MARQFKPVGFFVVMAVAAFVVCGVTACYTQFGAYCRTAEERSAYAIGEKAGEDARAEAKLPTAADLNMMLRSISSNRGQANSRVGTWLSRTVTQTGPRKRINGRDHSLKLCWPRINSDSRGYD